MAPAEGPTLAELGERALIERLGRFAPPGQFDDDAALLLARGTLVVNTDLLVEGVHFSDATTEPFHVGWRAAAANLSDLAAMGCRGGLGLTVGLVAPGSTPWAWVRELYRGLQACLEAHGGGQLLGGDCSTGQQRMVSLTALGLLPPAPRRGAAVGTESASATAMETETPAAIRRSDGRPGDQLVCTGLHGLSRLGLALLQGSLPEQCRGGLDHALVARAIQAHQQPIPRFDAVMALHASRSGQQPWRVAGADSSDGLAAAVAAVARASGCRALLDRGALPMAPGLAALEQAERWCLGGGEDFELVLALDSHWATALVSQLVGSGVIGELAPAAGSAGTVTWTDGRDLPVAPAGFQHFG